MAAPRRELGRRAAPFALAAVCCLPLVALAQAPDLDAGRAVVGGEDGSITPASCATASTGSAIRRRVPRLTGQAAYMYKQLIDYASEARPHDVMTPIAREMTEPQMANVAFYYSVLDAAHAATRGRARGAARGRKIAEDGLPEAGVQACNLCTARTARAIRRCSPTSPASTRPTRSCSCTSAARANDGLGVMRDIAEA